MPDIRHSPYSLNTRFALLLVLSGSVALLAVMLGTCMLIYGVDIFETGFRAISNGRVLLTGAVLLASRSAVRRLVRVICLTGPIRQRLSEQTCMSVADYRLTLVLPGVITGAMPLLAGLIAGSTPLMAWGSLMLAMTTPDMLTLWLLRSAPPACHVLRHSHRFGCLGQDSPDSP